MLSGRCMQSSLPLTTHRLQFTAQKPILMFFCPKIKIFYLYWLLDGKLVVTLTELWTNSLFL